MTRIILWLYIGVSVANVFAKAIQSEALNYFTKPLIIPLLLFYVYRSSLGKTTKRILLLGVALLFSWMGDVALMYQSDEIYFMAGIGLFLIAQITYILVLGESTYQKPSFNLLQAFPFALYAGLLFYILLPAGDFTIPIIIYGTVILIMAITAQSRKGNTSNDSYKIALGGSILFLLSDSLLAFNAFHTPFFFAEVFIMLTYCAAQFLLIEGVLKHVE